MATITPTFSWVIGGMSEKQKEGSLLDVVVSVNYQRDAIYVDGDNTYYLTNTGNYQCPSPSETDYTAYPDLTFEQVCGWLDAGLNVAEIDANLLSQIENQVNPPLISLPLPWVIPPPPVSDSNI